MNEALLRSAVRAHQAGNLTEAARLYGEILRADPRHFSALYSLGVLYYQAGRFEDAQRLTAEAIRVNQRSVEAFFARGCALQRLNRPAEALTCFDRALALRPDFADAKSHRELALAALRQPQIPQPAVALFTQGCGLARENRPAEALALLDQALALAPNFVEALTNRGALLLAVKRPEDALQSLDAAISINPGMAEAWNNRGNALSELGRYDEAVASYDKVIAARPDLFEALLNRGTALLSSRRPLEALTSYENALRTRPDNVVALNGRANALFELKRFEEAIGDYERVVAVDSDREYAAGILAFARLQCCDWRYHSEERHRLDAAVRQGCRVVNPFQYLALSSSPEDQKRCAEIWSADKSRPSSEPLWNGESYVHDKIRLAYLSGDFRNHAVAQAIAGVFDHHDKTRFHTMAISWGAPDNSDMRARLTHTFEDFIDVEGKADREIARRLRELEVDIAVDLMGFTAESRPGILAFRPAPIQINYLGFAGTMGAAFIDYLIADRIAIPEDKQRNFSEKILYLPNSFFPIDAQRRISATPPSRGEAGLPETSFVFTCFNNTYKYSPELFEIWMDLLRQVDGSVLWLSAADPAAARNLKREAESRGIDSTRLIFARFVPNAEDHLARLTLADLFLDTLPYNAHSTAADALRAGLPVLTCKGSTFAGRVAASLLHSAGLPELVTESLEDYHALALNLAREDSALAKIKVKLGANRETQPPFDTPRFTRNLEALYTEIFQHRNHAAARFSF